MIPPGGCGVTTQLLAGNPQIQILGLHIAIREGHGV